MRQDDLTSLIRPDRVHRSLYTDPAIFTGEMTTLFGGSWTFLAHASEVPGPHDYVRKRLGLRPVIVTRDGDGGVHALVNRCTHRGARCAGSSPAPPPVSPARTTGGRSRTPAR